MRTITITEGLSELKLLDARIEKAITNGKWCEECKNDIATDEYKATVTTRILGDWDSVNALMEERDKIKAAIVEANARNRVTVAGKEMTVAEAIERKTSIKYKKRFREYLVARFMRANQTVNQANEQVQRRIDQTLQAMVSSGTGDVDAAQKAIADNYMKTNGYQIIDPLKIEEKIFAIDSEINDFEKNVDIALSLNNATTFIEV